MMINKRLISAVPESKPYMLGHVLLQWLSLAASISMVLAVATLLEGLERKTATGASLAITALVVLAAALVRIGCTQGTARLSFLAARTVKRSLRQMIYQKLLRLGAAYKARVSTAEVVQVAVEGVDQLESYFGAYLPQFFYSLLAPVTLFAVLRPISMPAALALLLCVPLIPLTIAAVQTFAKKLLAKYWGQYAALGDRFLENLQGLTTLKIYQADARKSEEMAQESERFRRITMKVLTMQLNSITVMDVIAYGGAALGVFMAASGYRAGTVTLGGGLAIVLLSAEFFIPMRLLGSYFHIAMNGMAASEKIFRLLDLEEPREGGSKDFPAGGALCCHEVSFAYSAHQPVLRKVSVNLAPGSFTAVVGESGSGKSTLAALLTGRLKAGAGTVTAGGVPLDELSQDALSRSVTYVGFDSYLLKGTVEDALRMARPDADPQQLWQALEQVKLAEFLRGEQGLNTPLAERGANLSGGQRQRLALARALLHDSPVYIFDEATSNIDVESENDIMEQIQTLAQRKTVLLITHRLANARQADCIYVMADGRVTEQGRHEQLVSRGGCYARLWSTQSALEQYGKAAV